MSLSSKNPLPCSTYNRCLPLCVCLRLSKTSCVLHLLMRDKRNFLNSYLLPPERHRIPFFLIKHRLCIIGKNQHTYKASLSPFLSVATWNDVCVCCVVQIPVSCLSVHLITLLSHKCRQVQHILTCFLRLKVIRADHSSLSILIFFFVFNISFTCTPITATVTRTHTHTQAESNKARISTANERAQKLLK